MFVKSLFEKDLFRKINGVVKAEQDDSSIIWQELDEYVVTKELDRHFHSFFDVYAAALQQQHDPAIAGGIGVWISGFFGSGKSHFLKILSYLLQNHTAINPSTGISRTAAAFFQSKLNDAMLLANIHAASSVDTDVILFNIDSRANGQDGDEAILGVFWRVFNEMQGFCGDVPHIAAMERHLMEQERYTAFQEKYEELLGQTWLESRDTWLFSRDEVVAALAHALGQSENSAGKWFDDEGSSFVFSIDNFAKDVRRYLDMRGGNRHIIFLVDEVGQFIGSDTQRMLQLQTITENLGTLCGGRAWVIVTSQEDIESVLGEFRASRANDFSKIQGRFPTRLSLSSSNTDEVIQYRLLRKTDTAARELTELFQQKGDILRSQLAFTSDCATLKNFTSADDFIRNYPFVPYHFQLVQKVFESIRKAGATGAHLSRGERSMLDAFQAAARSVADRECGALVPLHAFYPSIESFLDTAVKATIDKAADNSGLQQPLDGQVLKTLFLIRYVDLLKPNVDNLVTLFIDEVDTDRLVLKRNMEGALQRLEKETLINRNGDLYYFLTNEERDISKEIKRVPITNVEQYKLLADLLYSDILCEQNKYHLKEYRRDYEFSRLLDGRSHASRSEQEISIEIISQFNDDFQHMDTARCIIYSSQHPGRVLLKMAEEQNLDREVATWCQTDSYIRAHAGNRDSTTQARILRERQEENASRRQSLRRIVEKLLMDAQVYALGQEVQLACAARNSPRTLLESAFDYLIRNTYSRFSLLRTLQDAPQQEIRAVLTTNTVGQHELSEGLAEVNPDAIREVESFIRLKGDGLPPTMQDLQDRYTRKPFGWPEWEIVLLIMRLYMSGSVVVMLDTTSDVSPRDVAEQVLKVSRWRSIKIIMRRKPAADDIRIAKILYCELTGAIAADSDDEVINGFRTLFTQWRQRLANFQRDTDSGNYPGGDIVRSCQEAVAPYSTLQDNADFAKKLANNSDALRDARDDMDELNDFFTRQRGSWDKLLTALREFGRNRISLDKDQEAHDALRRLESIRRASSPYGQIKEIEGLIARVSTIQSTQLSDYREQALQRLEKHLAQIMEELDRVNVDDATRNSILYPLQQTKGAIASASIIPDIAYQMREAEAAWQEAQDKLYALTHPTSPKTPDAPQKTVIRVRAASIPGGRELESPEDVAVYTETLRKVLLAKLGCNVRVVVE